MIRDKDQEKGIPNKDLSQSSMIREIILLIIGVNLLSASVIPFIVNNWVIEHYALAYIPLLALFCFSMYQNQNGRPKLAAILLIGGMYTSHVMTALAVEGFEAQVVISFVNLILISGFTLGKMAAILCSVLSGITTTLLFHGIGANLVAVNVRKEEPLLDIYVLMVTIMLTGGLVTIFLRWLEQNYRREQATMYALKEARDINLQRAQYSQLLVNLGSQMMRTDTVPQMSNIICMGIRAALKLDGIWIYDSAGAEIVSATSQQLDLVDEFQFPEPGLLDAKQAAELGMQFGLVGVDSGAMVNGPGVGGVSKALLLATQPVTVGKAEILFVNASLDLLASGIARHLAEQQLLRAQKMDVIDRMSAGIAHDFNNLLTTIIHSAEVIHRQSDDPVFAEPITAIRSATDRAANLTRKLLTFAQSSRQAVGLIDVRQIIHDIEPVLRQSIEERIVLALEKPKESLWIKSNASDVEQIILNLVLNARDAITETGMILIRLFREENRLFLIVEDNGQGMNETVKEKMFDPFFTTKESMGGHGLGLTTALSLVRSLNGIITVKSQPGEGAVVMVELPISESDQGSTRQPVAIHTRQGGDGRTVLLVEDDNQVRDIIKEILIQGDFIVEESVDGVGALLKLEAITNVDLIITDVVMPRMSGFKLSESLQQKGIQIPILFISGYAPKEISTTPTGKYAYLTKPFNSQQLLAAVSDLLT